MKRVFVIMLIAAMIIISSCQSGNNNPIIEQEAGQANEKIAFINLDDYEKYGVVSSTGYRYSDDELKAFQQDKKRQDYVAVVKEFVEQELKSELSFLDTADGTYNPRRITVGTSDGAVYALTLNRRHNYGDIWTINDYALYGQGNGEGAQPRSNTVDYELMDINDALQTVQDWASKVIAKKQRGHEYSLLDGKTYILLTAVEGESIELLDIYGDNTRIGISYANSIIDPDKRYGEKPNILIKVNSPIMEIVFNQYSSMIKEHPSLYTP